MCFKLAYFDDNLSEKIKRVIKNESKI